MKKFKIALLYLCASISALTQAQDSDTSSKTERVEITSLKGPGLKSYSQMLKGLKVYQEMKHLAPDSELYFILVPKNEEVRAEGVTMRLASDETSLPIPIDATGKFQLPLLELKSEDEYDLILNRPKGQFHIAAYVKSANLPDSTKRMGDLRLECQVRWAIEKQDVSIIFSTHVKLFASGNPCSTRVVSVYFFAPKGIDSISLDTPKQTRSFKIGSDGRYTVPLRETDISDDSLVRYAKNAAATLDSN